MNKESPWSHDWMGVKGKHLLFARRPENQYEALAKAGIGTEPDESVEELLELREVIADAIDELDDKHKFVFVASTIERLSVRQIAAEMGISKSNVHRILNEAKVTLRASLGTHAKVVSRLKESDDDQ